MIIDDVATQANILLIHHPDAITDLILIVADSINLVPLYMAQMDLCIMGKINQECSH